MVGIFNKKRNEKEAAEEAKKLAESKAKAEAARERLKLEAAQKEAEKAKMEAEAAKKELDKAKAEAALEKRQAELAKAAEAEKARKEKWEAERKAIEEEAAKKAAVIKHVWTNEDTYASLAMNHYGSQKSPFWRLIFEHNRHIIGDNPNSIKTGTEIEIPPLPDELKDQK
jgi:nucleoid-associated protein YgaU